MTQSRYSICITELATEMPRCFSISIQSEVACRLALRAFTEPAIWIAPENSSSFSVSVVLPASGCEMMAKVRRRRTWGVRSDMKARPSTQAASWKRSIIDGGWHTAAHAGAARHHRLRGALGREAARQHAAAHPRAQSLLAAHRS